MAKKSKRGDPVRRKGRRRNGADLKQRLRQIERGGALRRRFTTSRDALAAMIVVRAIERATGLAREDGSIALRRALSAAQKPLEEYIARQQRSPSQRRRKA